MTIPLSLLRTPAIRLAAIPAAMLMAFAPAACTTDPFGAPATVQGTATPAQPTPQELAARYSDPLRVSELRERALDLLIKMTSDANPQFRGNALEAMAVTPQRLEPLIGPALGDENPGVRTIAATMIGKANLRSLAPAARPLLNDPSPFVRASAIFALAKCVLPVDQSPLAKLLLSDPSPRVRAHAAYLIGELGDTSAMGLLHDAARASMPRGAAPESRMLQLQISEAMVKLGDDSQVAAIRSALYPYSQDDLEVAALAVQILGQLRNRASMNELILLSARRDENGQFWPAELRLGVAGALARMGNDRGSFLADEYAANPIPVLRAQAAYVYGQIGRTENLGKLESMMSDADGLVRLSAAAAILQTGTRMAAPQ